jgi:hypothetical protein
MDEQMYIEGHLVWRMQSSPFGKVDKNKKSSSLFM